MVAGGRNVGMNRRQIESRRKKQLDAVDLRLLVRCVSLLRLIVFCNSEIF